MVPAARSSGGGPLTEGRTPWSARIRSRLVSWLESHPYGYALGVKLVTATDLFLPHEQDYHGFVQLAAGRSSGLFLDLGANRGHSARGFAKLVPGWDVLSIEPNPLHESTLKRMSERDRRFRYRLLAVDETAGREVTLYVPVYRNMPMHSAAALTLAEARAGVEQAFPRQIQSIEYREVIVVTTTIDDLGVSPQIIKFDIQGKELAALRGGSRTLANGSPDLLVEVTMGDSALFEYLAGIGYAPYLYDHGAKRFQPYVDGVGSASRNVFFSTRELTTIGHAGRRRDGR
jgi:FkbM family methyltransferase